jgi:2-hydroxychromene-2-carboxylate isomerase
VKHITFYFDVVSPYAYLAFEQLPEALRGISCNVIYRPVLFAGLLKHYGQLGPAEIAPKREWTYRHVQWLAHTAGIALHMPLSHPFNPLPLLRLALACHPESPGQANRYVCESILRHIWRGGLEATDPQRFEALVKQLSPSADSQSSNIKENLKENTQLAISKGLFGVPSIEVDDKMFWGNDALPMLRDYLTGGPWFEGRSWQTASEVSLGASRCAF